MKKSDLIDFSYNVDDDVTLDHHVGFIQAGK